MLLLSTYLSNMSVVDRNNACKNEGFKVPFSLRDKIIEEYKRCHPEA